MRLLPVAVLVVLAAAPASAQTADWQAAPAARADTAAAPQLRTGPQAAADPAPQPPAAFVPAPFGAPATLPPPVSAPMVASAPPPLRAAPVAIQAAEAPSGTKPYGPQRVNFPGSVAAAFDVPYQTLKGFRPLTLDLYQPPPRSYPLPLLVFVHGGGDTRHAGTFADFPAVLASVAARGYVVASVNYRLSGEARFPAALLDVKAAIRWLKEHAGADTTRVAVWGASGGGQLAALVGLGCGVPALEQPDQAAAAPPDCVQAVIDWYGPADVKAPGGGKPGFAAPPVSDVGAFLGCEPASCPPGLTRIASPLSYISASSPAFLIQHGASDAVVPLAQSQALVAALKAKGVPAELVVYPDVGHDFARDGAPDPGVNRQALEKIAAFLAATFPPGPMNRASARPNGRGPLY